MIFNKTDWTLLHSSSKNNHVCTNHVTIDIIDNIISIVMQSLMSRAKISEVIGLKKPIWQDVVIAFWENFYTCSKTDKAIQSLNFIWADFFIAVSWTISCWKSLQLYLVTRIMLHIHFVDDHNHSPHAWVDIANHCHLLLSHLVEQQKANNQIFSKWCWFDLILI